MQLPNGMKLFHKKTTGNAVVVQVMVNVGSNDELPNERGIAHFLEHILFEGTDKRPNNRVLSNTIEKIGGEFNAYTTNERTCFYVKVMKKHFSLAVEILADILENSIFDKAHVQKEKNIVLKEIDMIYDDPGFYQWVLLQKNLFSKIAAKYPVYGDRNVIKKLTREHVMSFFEKYYVTNNMEISVVGNVSNVRSEVLKWFGTKKRKVRKRKKVTEPVLRSSSRLREKKDIVNTYQIMGFKTVPRAHKDSIVLDVIKGILGRGQSGRLFTEIRSKKGLAYDVGIEMVHDTTFGFAGAYATIDRKNQTKVKKMILEELAKLQYVLEEDIEEAKTYVEGNYVLGIEDGQVLADQMLFWSQAGGSVSSYLKSVRAVTVNDVRRVARKYFTNHLTTVLEGK